MSLCEHGGSVRRSVPIWLSQSRERFDHEHPCGQIRGTVDSGKRQGAAACSRDGVDLRPTDLAERCAAEAAKAGIPREEIEEAFGRLFEDRMAEAIDNAADVEVDRSAAEDG